MLIKIVEIKHSFLKPNHLLSTQEQKNYNNKSNKGYPLMKYEVPGQKILRDLN